MISYQKSFLIIIFFIISSPAWSWGPKGHQIIAYLGGYNASTGQAFWQSNLEPLRQLCTVPDRLWKEPSNKISEDPNHWFQIDAYYKPSEYDQIIGFPHSFHDASVKYTDSVIIKNGTAPWRIRQLYQLALEALKKQDLKTALQYVGTMSHYIGDLSQPLHVTADYDGHLTGNDGIHAYFESGLILDEVSMREDVQKRTLKLLNNPQFTSQFSGSLMDIILFEVKRSISLKDIIISNDTKYGRNKTGDALQIEIVKNQLADGAATLALVLNRLWQEAEVKDESAPQIVQDPAWIKNDFTDLNIINF